MKGKLKEFSKAHDMELVDIRLGKDDEDDQPEDFRDYGEELVPQKEEPEEIPPKRTVFNQPIASKISTKKSAKINKDLPPPPGVTNLDKEVKRQEKELK